MGDRVHQKMAQREGLGSRVRSPHREQYRPETSALHETHRSMPAGAVSTFAAMVASRFCDEGTF